MKNFFSRFGAVPSAKDGAKEEEAQKQLAQTQECLAKLRNAQRENFPLLNESTRLVQHLDATVSKMPEGDARAVWKAQVAELQRDLQAATEKMLSQKDSPAPVQPTAVEGGLDMFDGLSFSAGPTGMPALEGSQGGDIFSGLSLQGPPPSKSVDSPAVMPPAAEGAAPMSSSSGALPEDLFTGLGSLDGSSSPAVDPFLQPAAPGAPHPEPSPLLSRSSAPSAEAASLETSPAGLAGLSSDGKKKKRITRRVGRDRDQGDSIQTAAKLPMEVPSSAPASHSPSNAPEAAWSAADQSVVGGDSLDILSLATESAVPSGTGLQADPVALLDALPETSAATTDDAATTLLQAGVNQSEPHSAVPEDGLEEAAAAGDDLAAIARKEQTARQKRRGLQANIAQLRGKLDGLAAEESRAVEAEDFEGASRLSADSEALKAKLSMLQREFRAAEDAIQSLVESRWKASEAEAKRLREAADRLATKGDEAGDNFQAASKEAAQAEQHMTASKEAAVQTAKELEEEIKAAGQQLTQDEAAMEAEIAEASRPAAAARGEHAAVVEMLSQELDTLRAAVAAKEEALADAQAALERADHDLESSLMTFNEQQAALEAQRRRLQDQQEQLQETWRRAEAEEARLAESSRKARARAEKLQQQAEEARAKAAKLLAQAAKLEARAAEEQQAGAQLGELRRSYESAVTGVEEAQGQVETAKAAAQDLAAKSAGLHAAALAAADRGAAARRRLPEVEAGKKAAAAARDFKEAARLSAEAKALAASAEDAEKEAVGLREQAAEAATAANDAQQQAEAAAADLSTVETAAAAARLRLLKAEMHGVRQQLQAAVAADAFEEAEALQAELQAAQKEAEELAVSRGLEPSEHFESGAERREPDATAASLGSSKAAAPRLKPSAEDTAGEGGSLESEREASTGVGPGLLSQQELPDGSGIAGEPLGAQREVPTAPEPDSNTARLTAEEGSSPKSPVLELLSHRQSPDPFAAGISPAGTSCAPPDLQQGTPSEAAEREPSDHLRDAIVPEGFPTLTPRVPSSPSRRSSMTSRSSGPGGTDLPVFPSLGPRLSTGANLDKLDSTELGGLGHKDPAFRVALAEEGASTSPAFLGNDSLEPEAAAADSKHMWEARAGVESQSNGSGSGAHGESKQSASAQDDMFAGLSFG